jgi:hypothetical protein
MQALAGDAVVEVGVLQRAAGQIVVQFGQDVAQPPLRRLAGHLDEVAAPGVRRLATRARHRRLSHGLGDRQDLLVVAAHLQAGRLVPAAPDGDVAVLHPRVPHREAALEPQVRRGVVEPLAQGEVDAL